MLSIVAIAFLILYLGYVIGVKNKNLNNSSTIIVNLSPIDTTMELSFVDSVKIEINKYPFLFKDIVLKQAIAESGGFKSNVYKKHNNMFGMKSPLSRLTTNKNSKSRYAHYSIWKDCILDRFIFECTYLYKYKSREKYISYLQENYGEKIDYLK